MSWKEVTRSKREMYTEVSAEQGGTTGVPVLVIVMQRKSSPLLFQLTRAD